MTEAADWLMTFATESTRRWHDALWTEEGQLLTSTDVVVLLQGDAVTF